MGVNAASAIYILLQITFACFWRAVLSHFQLKNSTETSKNSAELEQYCLFSDFGNFYNFKTDSSCPCFFSHSNF